MSVVSKILLKTKGKKHLLNWYEKYKTKTSKMVSRKKLYTKN